MIELLGTTSATCSEDDADGENGLDAGSRASGLAEGRKVVVVLPRVGRRLGREEKVLWVCIDLLANEIPETLRRFPPFFPGEQRSGRGLPRSAGRS